MSATQTKQTAWSSWRTLLDQRAQIRRTRRHREDIRKIQKSNGTISTSAQLEIILNRVLFECGTIMIRLVGKELFQDGKESPIVGTIEKFLDDEKYKSIPFFLLSETHSVAEALLQNAARATNIAHQIIDGYAEDKLSKLNLDWRTVDFEGFKQGEFDLLCENILDDLHKENRETEQILKRWIPKIRGRGAIEYRSHPQSTTGDYVVIAGKPDRCFSIQTAIETTAPIAIITSENREPIMPFGGIGNIHDPNTPSGEQIMETIEIRWAGAIQNPSFIHDKWSSRRILDAHKQAQSEIATPIDDITPKISRGIMDDITAMHNPI